MLCELFADRGFRSNQVDVENVRKVGLDLQLIRITKSYFRVNWDGEKVSAFICYKWKDSDGCGLFGSFGEKRPEQKVGRVIYIYSKVSISFGTKSD